MVDPKQIPPEVVEAAELEILSGIATDIPSEQIASLALRAALAAWPGMSQLEENDSAIIRDGACLILPLPQEPRK